MKITNDAVATRLISAIERENLRTELYNQQMAAWSANDRDLALKIQTAIDELEGDTDY